MEKFFVSVVEAAHLCGAKSRGWIYRQAKVDPSFPMLVKLGQRKTVINLAQLKAWVEGKSHSAN